jgi:ribosomal protein S18 acetylase RimI-like enzyme
VPELELQDRERIADYLLRDRDLNVYQLGDLGDFYWPNTRWFGWESNGKLEATALYFTGLSLPTLISVDRTNMAASRNLLSKLGSILPDRVYAHLQHDHIESLVSEYDCSRRSRCLKMTLQNHVEIQEASLPPPTELGAADATELQHFYDHVYPEHWFEPQMMTAGYYYGIREGRALIAVAGVHVVSRKYRVAALGNIATAPEYRGRGLAKGLTLHVCHQLRRDGIDLIGLNVGRDNEAARATYARVGFEVICEYEEMLLTKKVSDDANSKPEKCFYSDDNSTDTSGG